MLTVSEASRAGSGENAQQNHVSLLLEVSHQFRACVQALLTHYEQSRLLLQEVRRYSI